MFTSFLLLQVLQDIVQAPDEDTDFYVVPPLGKNFAEKWKDEDLMEKRRQSW